MFAILVVEAPLERAMDNPERFTADCLASSFPKADATMIDAFTQEASATATPHPSQLQWEPLAYWRSKP